MSDKYVLATDDNGNLAVRTVTAEESPTANSTDVITATTDGKLAVRVVGAGGGGGGDQHNLGWYATESALTTAHPTASDGDYAIVGETDTVWVWDSDTTAWKDTDTKGQVTSVNGQTGDVVITGNDVLPDQTGNSGKFLTTDGTDASWSDKPLVNTATATNSLTILGTANTTYTNSVNIGVGSSVTWTESVAIGYGAKAKQGTAIGRDAVSTGSGGIKIGIGSMSGGDAVGIGSSAVANANFSVAVGRDTRTTAENAVAIGMQAEATAKNAIQIGGGTNSTTRTFAVGLGYWDNVTHTYRLLDSDGTIPAARHASLPAADGTYTLQLVIADGVPTLSWVAV